MGAPGDDGELQLRGRSLPLPLRAASIMGVNHRIIRFIIHLPPKSFHLCSAPSSPDPCPLPLRFPFLTFSFISLGIFVSFLIHFASSSQL